MSYFYEAIGRLTVFVVMRRFGRPIRVVGAVSLAGALIGGAVAAYLLASRDVEEG